MTTEITLTRGVKPEFKQNAAKIPYSIPTNTFFLPSHASPPKQNQNPPWNRILSCKNILIQF